MFLRGWVQLAVAVAAAASCAKGASTDFVTLEDVAVPHSWERRAAADPNELVPLSIALRTRGEERVVDKLMQTSDPDSDEYLQHLTKEEVLDLLKPAPHTRNEVVRWLTHNGVEESSISYSVAGDVLHFTVTVAEASELLGGAVFSKFQRRDTGELSTRTTKYAVPRGLEQHIEFVGGSTTYFPTTEVRRSRARVVGPAEDVPDVNDQAALRKALMLNPPGMPASCNVSQVTSMCLREFYGTANYTVQTSQSHIGIAGFLGENANYDDLDMFLKKQRPEAYAGHATYNYVTFGGAENVQNRTKAGGEANLDIQTVEGVTWPMRTTYYLTGTEPPFHKDAVTPKNTNEPYLVFLEEMMKLGVEDLPQVLSVSYGDDEQTVPAPYARRACTMFAALGLRGTSVLFASGDEGVGAGETKKDADKCVTNDGKNKKTFLPSFPPSCPWITAVGATYKFDPEVVTVTNYTFITSGGGFSNHFPRPFYQEHAVHKYLAEEQRGKDAGWFNPLGRAYPDVAAQGSRFVIAVDGEFELISGTSASTPLFASIVALLNDARMAKNKPALGFLNPVLYKRLGRTKGFHDVVSGSAQGCGDKLGFEATKGWDPVTGWGTPYFPTLLDEVMKL